VPVTDPSDVITQEWLNRSRDVELRFRAGFRPQLALWLEIAFWFPVILSAYTTYEVGTECYETSAHDIQTPGNHPKERKLQNTAKVRN
jgi:hypothetical protein